MKIFPLHCMFLDFFPALKFSQLTFYQKKKLLPAKTLLLDKNFHWKSRWKAQKKDELNNFVRLISVQTEILNLNLILIWI